MSAAGGAALRVLLIDDDRFTIALLAELLETLGVHQLSTAADGRQGLAVFDTARPRPDVVLVDLSMPGQDGFQLLEALARRRYDGGLILISGKEDRLLHAAAQLARFHQLQLLAALPKPVERAALAAALARLP